MDLWLFAGDTIAETLRHAWNLWSGRHLESDQVQCIPFRQLSITSQSQMHFQVDGEPKETNDIVNIVVRPKALRVLIPSHAPRALFTGDASG
jgi:diacylglycerol kinase family enzyme